MHKDFILPISVEKFAAYLDGNMTADEMHDVSSVIENNAEMKELIEDYTAVDETLVAFVDADLLLPPEIENMSFDIPKIDNNMNIETNSITFEALSVDDIQQKYDDTCAIKAQQIILQSHGIDVSEDDLIKESIEKGWYRPGGGTRPEDVGNLLQEHGMEVHKYSNASFEDIANEIGKGNNVIVGIDSGELWHPGTLESIEDFVGLSGADHALIASGVSVNPLTSEQEITLTDPGTGEVAQTYNADQFNDAWGDSDNFMVTAEF